MQQMRRPERNTRTSIKKSTNSTRWISRSGKRSTVWTKCLEVPRARARRSKLRRARGPPKIKRKTRRSRTTRLAKTKTKKMKRKEKAKEMPRGKKTKTSTRGKKRASLQKNPRKAKARMQSKRKNDD
jgi:hypothetical protein